MKRREPASLKTCKPLVLGWAALSSPFLWMRRFQTGAQPGARGVIRRRNARVGAKESPRPQNGYILSLRSCLRQPRILVGKYLSRQAPTPKNLLPPRVIWVQLHLRATTHPNTTPSLIPTHSSSPSPLQQRTDHSALFNTFIDPGELRDPDSVGFGVSLSLRDSITFQRSVA